MRFGIVSKLFLLTMLLCMLLLTMIFIGQTVFFKQFYANQKVKHIQKSMQSFEEAYVIAGDDSSLIRQLQDNFYKENMTWIAVIDHAGNIKGANDFSVDVQVNRSLNQELLNEIVNVPLYSFVNLEDLERVKFDLEPGNLIFLDGIKFEDTIVPALLTISHPNHRNKTFENIQLSENIYGLVNVTEPSPVDQSQFFFIGEIMDLHLPVGSGSNLYSNRTFIERLKQFQADLIFKQKYDVPEALDFVENNVKYKLLITPVKKDTDKTDYIFAMTSLQPVDEAVQMLEEYYIYIIVLVLILVIIASFYYSKKIAKPLLQINDTTSKMAQLDFSETIHVRSNDEIGMLSNNINSLSSNLHSYIHQLQQDIEKEKQLEQTRKQFISGVSHELKTPLSIIKSCISILKDGVAADKKDYYFQAMAKEVDKMDLLIVDMLELAKFESGTYHLEMRSFYIDQMIEYICKKLELEFGHKQLKIKKQLEEKEVVGNELRIEQVITNFLTNAIRYTPEKHEIMISATEESDRVKISIENKGIQIAQEHIEKIWDRFYRGDESRSRSRGGTGLGLAISKQILELHGSEYGVRNTEDGVLFYFYLNIK